MAEKTKTKTEINKTAIVVGAAGAAAAAIGAYWLYGAKNAAKHRKMASSWMLKARAEVMDAVEKVKEIDKETYLRIVDDVVEKYAKLQKNNADIAEIAKEMKAAWSHIRAVAKPARKEVKKTVKKVVKKVSNVVNKLE